MDMLTIVILLATLLTAVILVTGIGAMMQGGEFDAKHGTQLMFARVGMQAVTFLLLLTALFLAG